MEIRLPGWLWGRSIRLWGDGRASGGALMFPIPIPSHKCVTCSRRRSKAHPTGLCGHSWAMFCDGAAASSQDAMWKSSRTYSPWNAAPPSQVLRIACLCGSSHKCMHDLAPGRAATAVGRRCGCARARHAAVQSSVAQLTAACAGPALGGEPARRQPDKTQAADSMALTWRRTVKASRTWPRLSPKFCAGAERSLTVQPPWNWHPVTIPVSAVAGPSGSPQLLSRYRQCSLVQ